MSASPTEAARVLALIRWGKLTTEERSAVAKAASQKRDRGEMLKSMEKARRVLKRQRRAQA